jgi:hypothetical protein
VVPGVSAPLCCCGEERETPDHLILRCPATAAYRPGLWSRIGRPLHTRRDLAEATEVAESARNLTRWLIGLDWLLEYRVAAQTQGIELAAIAAPGPEREPDLDPDADPVREPTAAQTAQIISLLTRLLIVTWFRA